MFCLPMILSVLGEDAARSLLQYRYLHLDKARENARKLGCQGALYPMVTFNGEECHNEWEITFEEIHRNAAIFYAIFLTYEYGGDEKTLREYGLPVMLEICRYWVSRATWNPRRRRYMILGVTGPNEYENNVCNNWYTNRMAKFCLEQTVRYVRSVIGTKALRKAGGSARELSEFQRVAEKMYLPEDKRLGVFVQHDGFLDKELRPADSLDAAERPLNQHWSWDRILRSCFIKQADVLQGLYCLRHLYDRDTIDRNFAFYEPMTVHESSLSPCVHAILAADCGRYDKAVEMYRRTARLDLDNVNNDTEDGLHITSMCGSWMAIVKGFAGVRTERGCLELCPHVPWAFRSFAFTMQIQGRRIDVAVEDGTLSLTLLDGAPLMVKVYDQWLALQPARRSARRFWKRRPRRTQRRRAHDSRHDFRFGRRAGGHGALPLSGVEAPGARMVRAGLYPRRQRAVQRRQPRGLHADSLRDGGQDAFGGGLCARHGAEKRLVCAARARNDAGGRIARRGGLCARGARAGVRCAIGSASKNCRLVLERTALPACLTRWRTARSSPAPSRTRRFSSARRGCSACRPRIAWSLRTRRPAWTPRAPAGMRCCAVGSPADLTGYDWICSGLNALSDTPLAPERLQDTP